MRILICISGMPYSESTVRFGSLMASLQPSEVTLLIVADTVDSKAEAEQTLAAAARLVSVPVKELRVSYGSRQEQILLAASSGYFDMLVVGSRIAVSLPDLWLRPLSQRLAEKAQVSVLVVKEERPFLRRLLICTSGTHSSRMVVQFGARLAAATQAEANLLHVAKSIPSMYAGLHGMEETLAQLLQTDTPLSIHLRWAAAELNQLGVSGRISVRRGLAVNEIVREATEGGYDLVIIGAPDESSRLRFLLAPVIATQLVNRVPCSVLVSRGARLLTALLEET